MIKKIITFILNGIYKVLYPIINPIITLLQKAFYASYAIWISQSFKQKNIYFKYPINKIIGQNNMSIGNRCSFGKEVVLTTWSLRNKKNTYSLLSIGNNCQFGDYLHLTCANSIIIDDNVLTGRWVTISDNSHGESTYEDLKNAPLDREVISKGPIKIGKNVWIGDKATILAGVEIGEGAIIAANSVVTKNIPPFSVAGGCPIKIIKTLNSEL